MKVVSLNKYMKEHKVGRETVKRMIDKGQLRTTGGERPKIILPEELNAVEIKELLNTILTEIRNLNAHLGVRGEL